MIETRALPPGPRMPGLLQGWLAVTRTATFLERCARRHGDPFTLRLPVGGSHVLFSAPAAVREIFTGPPDVLHAGEANDLLVPLLGPSSLLVLDGPRHLQQRHLMLPAFHGERMLAYGGIMRDVTDRVIARWPIERAMPLLPEMQRITLEVILRTVFGLD
jgi:cytochrome P450